MLTERDNGYGEEGEIRHKAKEQEKFSFLNILHKFVADAQSEVVD